MSLLGSVFGTDSEAQSTTDDRHSQKYAVLLNAGPSDTPVAGNGFNYALELAESGYEVELFLDGEATKWPAEFADQPDRPYSHDWQKIEERGLLAGACGYCANAFDVADACKNSGVDLLSDADEHAPAIAQLAAEDYEILTVG
ncbi:DsrE family protein [Halovenus sp. HT40]|uniref:DsrE family protein n=1 Tax=Halovenus sp. HT40 TaxID=3126691 RepID=UPI00300EC237